MTEPDLIQEAFRQAIRREWRQTLQTLMWEVELTCISTPILLALILWRVW